MRFDRYPKVEGLRWTPRMEALHLSRQERATEKIARAYPLFSDQIEVPQALSVDEERERRERLLFQSEQRMRDLFAKHAAVRVYVVNPRIAYTLQTEFSDSQDHLHR